MRNTPERIRVTRRDLVQLCFGHGTWLLSAGFFFPVVLFNLTWLTGLLAGLGVVLLAVAGVKIVTGYRTLRRPPRFRPVVLVEGVVAGVRHAGVVSDDAFYGHVTRIVHCQVEYEIPGAGMQRAELSRSADEAREPGDRVLLFVDPEYPGVAAEAAALNGESGFLDKSYQGFGKIGRRILATPGNRAHPGLSYEEKDWFQLQLDLSGRVRYEVVPAVPGWVMVLGPVLLLVAGLLLLHWAVNGRAGYDRIAAALTQFLHGCSN